MYLNELGKENGNRWKGVVWTAEAEREVEAHKAMNIMIV